MTITDVAKILLNNDNFEILTHKNPDGDCLGSGYALCLALQQSGKNAKVISHPAPKLYDFLKKGVADNDFTAKYIVSVDVADEKLLGNYQEKYSGKINLCIDHHQSNVIKADYIYVDKDASATGEIIYEILKAMNVEITKEIANCLYTAISTDTGCFKYSNVTEKTFKIAGDLLKLGCDNAYINRIIFDTKTKKHIQLEKQLYENIIYCCDEKCAIIYTDLETENYMDKEDMEGISSIPRGIEGVEIGITIREKENGVCRVSVRTHGKYDACEFCSQFGGGGHKCASGCAIKGNLKDVIETLIKAVEKII